jgi:mono/diheme cytochrome c family protein
VVTRSWIASGVSVCVALAAVFRLGVVDARPQEAHPPQPHRHPLAEKITNPVPRSFQSIAAGRRIYATLCVRCHGPAGKGDGGGAGGGGQPADLTDEVWDHGASDGEIFVVLRDGTSVDMEGYAERVSETDLWNLVHYLRELRTKNEPHRSLEWRIHHLVDAQ